MLTPRFKLDQDDNFLIITIYAPFTNISDTEIFIDDLDFRFYSKPYFLRLHLPHSVEETDLASAKYDADTTSFIVKAPKKSPGQFFPGLEMITDLLNPKGSENVVQHEIEILGEGKSEDNEEEIDWYFDQQLPECDVEQKATGGEYSYGFGFGHVNVFNKLLDEFQEILDVKDLDRKSFNDRKLERKQLEGAAFSSEHYLADLFDANDDLNNILNLTSKRRDPSEFSKEETERMVALGTQRKARPKVSKEHLSTVSFGLLDILCAYCYDLRTTEFEHNSESGWTVCKLSATLCCGEKYVDIKECVITCIRRSLCYPLYRRWDLSLLVWKDVCDLLQFSGKRGIVKALLNIIPLLVNTEGYYLFNQLYIEDYVIWCQSRSDKWVAKCLDSLKLTLKCLSRSDIELNLDELESFGKQISQQGKTENDKEETDLLERIAALEIGKNKPDSGDSECDSDDSVVDENSSDSDSSDSSGSTDSDDSDTDDLESDEGRGKGEDNERENNAMSDHSSILQKNKTVINRDHKCVGVDVE